MQEADLRKGPWLEEEDDHLAAAVSVLGDKRWDALAKASGISLFFCLTLKISKWWIKVRFVWSCRDKKEWQELQAAMDELSPSQSEARQHLCWRRENHHWASSEMGKQVLSWIISWEIYKSCYVMQYYFSDGPRLPEDCQEGPTTRSKTTGEVTPRRKLYS